MTNKPRNKMIDPDRTKEKEREYNFPAQNGDKAVCIKATNQVDAMKKYEKAVKKD